jgi:hypothetical protein
MAASAAKVLSPETVFCAAVGLSGPGERVIRMKVASWRTALPALGKTPAVFLLLSAAAQKAHQKPASPDRHDGRPAKENHGHKKRFPG